jgi:multidrug efflux system membrane fusion protein
VNTTMRIITAALALGLLAQVATAQDATPVRVAQVREKPVERVLPLTGRVYSRNDANMGLTLSGELEYVLEPGTQVTAGEVFGRLDQKPILLRKAELEHLVDREKVNAAYLEREQLRLRRLREANNASERLVDESESNRDISRMELRSLQARIDQIDDELRRSQLVAPFTGVIAERHKRGGEYARPGDIIARLVDLEQLELRFEVPLGYLGRVTTGEAIAFVPQGGQLLGASPGAQQAQVRTIIRAADTNSQTFEVRADINDAARDAVIAGQLVNVSLQISSTQATVRMVRRWRVENRKLAERGFSRSLVCPLPAKVGTAAHSSTATLAPNLTG